MGNPITKKILIALFVTLSVSNIYADETTELSLSKPPASIGEWYQPSNERQVWLQTMFRLRRQMQAISEYSAYEDKEHLTHWVEQFTEDYKSIGEMVPEWADELEMERMEELERAASKGDYAEVAEVQQKIARSCMGCHKEYRAVTAALYRGMNFSDMTVEDSETMEEQKYKDAMIGLGRAMDRIAIGIADQRFEAAASGFQLLEHRLVNVSESCSSCHETNKQRDYLLGSESTDKVNDLGKWIDLKDVKQSQQALRGIGTNICSRCHAIHRTLSDLRGFIQK